jgi:hypothetical protein
MEHHFVVKFNAETRTWSWDVETENAVFTEGTILLLGKHWVRSGNIMESHPHIYGLDEVCSKVLTHALGIMNDTIKEGELFKPIPPMDKKSVTEMDGVS